MAETSSGIHKAFDRAAESYMRECGGDRHEAQRKARLWVGRMERRFLAIQAKETQ